MGTRCAIGARAIVGVSLTLILVPRFDDHVLKVLP
jgi:hypothetical protein